MLSYRSENHPNAAILHNEYSYFETAITGRMKLPFPVNVSEKGLNTFNTFLGHFLRERIDN